MMATQISKESPKTSEVLTFLLPVLIQGEQENIKYIDSRHITVGLEKTVIHQCKIPDQHLVVGRSPSKITEEFKTVEIYSE